MAYLRDEYLSALEQEIAEGRFRLARVREGAGSETSPRADALAAISDVTLDWLKAERDRVRAGGEFDEDEARRLLERTDSAPPKR